MRVMDELAQITRDLKALAERVEALQARRMGKDTHAGAITLLQRSVSVYAASPAPLRTLVGFTTTNATTGRAISCDRYSLAQLERMAYKFARLATPTRAAWRGDRAAYGVMRALFEQHGGIIRHPHTRAWAWAADAPQRRVIAARIVATVTPPRHRQAGARGVNV